MDRKYIDMHLLADRYVQGSLAGRELDEFEERLVWDEALIEEVRLAEILREGLKQSIAAGRGSVDTAPSPVFGRLSEFLSVPAYAAAASFVLAVGLTTGILLGPLFEGPNGSATDTGAIEIVPLFVTRSELTPTVTVDSRATSVLLVDVAGNYDSYRVTLRSEEGGDGIVFVKSDLQTTYPDSLAIGLPADLPMPGGYVLRIEGVLQVDAGEPSYEHVQDIRFRAMPATRPIQ